MKRALSLGADKPRVRRKPERKLYNLSAWRRAHGFRAAILVQNPICQRIIQGQCTQPATVVHHLADPAVCPQGFFDPANVVCVCARHHPGGELGTMQWRVGVDYVATKWEVGV